MAMSLPSIQEIKSWSDERLLSVIRSGEAINWDGRMNETQEEFDAYVNTIYAEKELRNLY